MGEGVLERVLRLGKEAGLVEELVDPALRLMMDAVHRYRYDGYVAQSLGDGIFALFGAPLASEDHAHRAE
jgi:class 3 adenylate cyclase